MKLSKETKVRAANHLARTRLIPFIQIRDEKYRAEMFHYHAAHKLEAVEAGTISRLMLYAPPRHGKSRLTAVEFAAWLLGRDPSRKIILASYSSDLAIRHSKLVRDILDDTNYQALFPATKINPEDRSAEFWNTTAGGYLKGVGVGGSLTGHGADFLIIDDPFKDHQESHSPTTRETVWQWYLSTAYTRLSPEGRIIIINTRWNMDDLCGRILNPKRRSEMTGEGEQWVEINYPALAVDGDVLGRAVGAPLCPGMFSEYRLNIIRNTVGHYLWSALYQGKPVPSDGHRINPNWFEIIQPEDVPAGLSWERYWDLACTKNQTSDSTAGVAGAMDGDGYFYLRDMIAGQWDWPGARQRIVNTAIIEHGVPLGIEAVAGFLSAYQNLREVVPPTTFLSQYSPDTDKHSRALPWIALAENRKVRLVAGGWITEFLNQAAEFPKKGCHDDMIDAVSGVYEMLAGNQSGSFSGDTIDDVLLGQDRDWVMGDRPSVIEEVFHA